MRRVWILLGLVCLVVQPLVAESLRERVRQAASVIYVHGMTAEIAEQEVGAAGVPYLLELLRDPEFVRRDNVVAFLAYLGYDGDAPALVEFLDHPPTDGDSPEEFRARILVPEALGRIASRGGAVARELLDRLADDSGLRDMDEMASMVDYGLALADGVIEPEPAVPVDPELAPDAIDTNALVHLHDLDHANHINTNSPMGDGTVDALLDNVTYVMSLQNGSSDTACCIQLGRTEPGAVFGTNGDGLDVITTSGELNAVIGQSVARVKVVDYIGWCGSPGSNIIGCGFTPGKGMVVVRISGSANEGKLWAHEFGHNTGLGHNPSSGYIMSGGLSAGNTKLTQSECNKYHFPSGAAQAVPIGVGNCEDDDGDLVTSAYDNCPDAVNPGQSDADGDGLGNECDNCLNLPNPDQIDCDHDSLGDACDPEVYVPPAIEPIYFVSDEQIEWSPVAARKRIYRGDYDGSVWQDNEELVGTLNQGDFWVTTVVPDSGVTYYYLVRAFNNCGESP